jgi:transaldolase
MDWWKNHDKVNGFEPSNDPGVKSVTEIYNYFKKFGYKTVVMGASFRNKGEILELAGCDRLTISPQLLEELSTCHDTVEMKLNAESAKSMNLHKIEMSESTFRWMMNEDAMATEKLAEGIRNFAADIVKLENIIKSQLHQN